MALTTNQLLTLRRKLEDEKEKLSSVLKSLDEENVVNNTDRLNDNADIGTEAIEEDDLVRNESLRAKTVIMLDRIEVAFNRMNEGTYGKTDEGEEIPFERLSIDPTATTNVV